MKAVMISIRPEWVAKILSGEKTVEVRKTAPKLETPFRCYIYETQGKTDTPWIDEEGHTIFRGRGMVIGEFVCDCIGTYWFLAGDPSIEECEDVKRACLSAKEILEYANTKELHFWNVSNLKVYDKPISIGNFKVTVTNTNWSFQKKLERPPQSWCYVEEL